VDKNKTK